jgi:hypothetical protein
VAETYFGDIRVSTIFLPLTQVNKETGEYNMLFETMIFADEPLLQRLSSHSV